MHSAYAESERKKNMIGENIRKARKAAGMSQAELAERLKVRQKDVSRWENGAHMPSLEIFAEICRQLDASADEVLGLKQND